MGTSRKSGKRTRSNAELVGMLAMLDPEAQDIARRLIDVFLAEKAEGRSDLLRRIERLQSRAGSRGGPGLTEIEPAIRRAEARMKRH